MIPRGVGSADGHTHLAPVLSDRWGAAATRGPSQLRDPDLLIQHLDANELTHALVTVPPPFFRQDLPEGESAAWVRDINDGLLERIGDRDRLLPLAYLPMEHPAVALAELLRIHDDAAWVGFSGSTGAPGVNVASDDHRPLWAALDDHSALLSLHPGESPDVRMDDFYLANLVGNPVETAIAAAQLVFGNVLMLHSRVRVLLMHCGGAVPSLVGRWDRGYETSRPGLENTAEPPSTGVRRLFADTLSHDSGLVALAASHFGHDHLVLGSDWPFPMGSENPAAVLDQLSPAQQAGVLAGVARLLADQPPQLTETVSLNR